MSNKEMQNKKMQNKETSNNEPYFSLAISGKSGCGNTTVVKNLSKRLHLKAVNYTFHTIADDEGVPFKQICEEAETDTKWDYLVDKKQIELAESENSILGSRLAIWLHKKATLTIFLSASDNVRYQRIADREGKSFEEAKAETEARDKRDHDRYMKLYNIDNHKYDFVDIIVNNDKLPPEEVADILEAAAIDMRKKLGQI